MWSRISGGILKLNICLCSNLTCHSITVTVRESFATYVTFTSFLSPLFLLLILVLLEDLEERGEQTTLWFFAQIQKGKLSNRVPRSFHSNPEVPSLPHGRICSLSDTRKCCCAWAGWTDFFILNNRSLQTLQRSLLALLEQMESSVPLQAPPSAASMHVLRCSSLGCVSSSSAVLRGVGFLEPLLQALATSRFSLILLLAGSLPRKACEELRGNVWMVPHSVQHY